MSNNTKYYYFPPINPQYFFPKKRFKFFLGYYTPFSCKAKFFWFIFSNIPLIRIIFLIKEDRLPRHFIQILDILNVENASVFFNKGTPGPEQKTTAIAKNDNQQWFVKFGTTEIAKQLIDNEVEALSTAALSSRNSVLPKVITKSKTKNYSYFLTKAIVGHKLETTELNSLIFQFLISFQIDAKTNTGLCYIFSHGDFCPWNILVNLKGDIIPIDWEMAENKPLGYDLLTFIFHTNFLLNPRKEIDKILSDNIQWIEQYFDYYNINDYQKYLYSFASQRAAKESGNQTKTLYNKYIELVAFYE